MMIIRIDVYSRCIWIGGVHLDTYKTKTRDERGVIGMHM